MIHAAMAAGRALCRSGSISTVQNFTTT